MTIEYALVYMIDAKVRENQDAMNKITVLRLATGRTKGDVDTREVKKLGVDARFSKVYINDPRGIMDYLKEWNFYIILSDEEMPDGIMTKRKSLELFSDTPWWKYPLRKFIKKSRVKSGTAGNLTSPNNPDIRGGK